MLWPGDFLAQHILLQPELRVLPNLLGVVMAAGLDREGPGHARLESLEALEPPLVAAVMIVGAVEKERGRGDERHMRLGRDRREVDLLPGRLRRIDGRLGVHPDMLVPVILGVADAEIGDDRLHPGIGAEVPHQRAAIRIALGTEPARIDLLLTFQVAQHPSLDRVPDIVGRLPGIGDRLAVEALGVDRPADGAVHIPVPQGIGVLRVLLAVSRLAAVVERHHSPAIVHVILRNRGRAHPPMHVEKAGGLHRPSLHLVEAIDADF